MFKSLCFLIILINIVYSEKLLPVCPKLISGVFPFYKNNGKYIECVYGLTRIRYCEDWKAFDPKSNKCINKQLDTSSNDIEDSETPLIAYISLPFKFSGPFPHPTDCDRYIIHSHGNIKVKTCEPGFFYHPISTICDVPRLVPGCNETFGNGLNYRADLYFTQPNIWNGEVVYDITDNLQTFYNIFKSTYRYQHLPGIFT